MLGSLSYCGPLRCPNSWVHYNLIGNAVHRHLIINCCSFRQTKLAVSFHQQQRAPLARKSAWCKRDSSSVGRAPGLLAAFDSGVLSFLAPCVVPLVPAYLSFLAGTSITVASATPATLDQS